MNKSQKIISPKLQLNPLLWQDLSNYQQETIKGGGIDTSDVIRLDHNKVGFFMIAIAST